MPPRRPFTPDDIRRQVVLDEHDLSADGRLAVVVRRVVRGDRYVSHLWAIPLDPALGRRPWRLTSGLVRDGHPRIAPDGGAVAFVRTWPDDEDRRATIHLVRSRGGAARPLRLGLHGGVSEIEWAPDGSRLAYTAPVDPPRFMTGRVPPLVPTRGGKSDDSPTARTIARTDWRYDDFGHLDRWSHLFVIETRRGAQPRQVTAGDWGVMDIAWSPGGRTVAFAADRGPDPDLRPRTTIWAVDVDADGDEPSEVMAPVGWATRPAYDPAGTRLAALGIADPDPLDDVSPALLVGPADGSAPPVPIGIELDRPFANLVNSDLHGWMVDGRGGPAWLGPDALVCIVTDRGRSVPWRVGLDEIGGIEPLAAGEITTHEIAVASTGLVSMLATIDSRPMELLTVEASLPATTSARPHARTTMGGSWRRPFREPGVQVVHAPGPGGPIEAWVTSPAGSGDRALPTIMSIHGGPLLTWGPAPSIEALLLVDRGYRVVTPNIRGGATYGAAWIRPQLGDWGGVDADDVHATLDHVIGAGLTDPRRVGILGLSYGGFMVNWMAGTSDRFAAGVCENGVANQVSAWANSDSGAEYSRVALLGDPLDQDGVDKLWRQSPLRHVANVHAPLLLLQAEADLRCPPADAEQFFIALRNLGRTVEYVLYPDEFHGFQASGRIDRRIDRHTRMLDWFDRYVWGQAPT